MIFLIEAAVTVEFAGQQTEQDGNPHDHADTVLDGFGEKQLFGFAFQQVVAHLDAVQDIMMFVQQKGLFGLLEGLDAQSGVLDLAVLFQSGERFPGIVAAQFFRIGTVQLQQIERVDLKTFQTLFGGEDDVVLSGILADTAVAHVVFVVGIIKIVTGFGGDNYIALAAFFQNPGNQILGVPEAVDIGGVDEGDALIEGGVQGLAGDVIVRRSPVHTADSPGAETDCRNSRAAFSELCILHVLLRIFSEYSQSGRPNATGS